MARERAQLRLAVNASITGSVGPSWGCGAAPYVDGSTSGPPLNSRPDRWSSSASTFSLVSGGSATGSPPAISTARM
jgi:hypothetical protein